VLYARANVGWCFASLNGAVVFFVLGSASLVSAGLFLTGATERANAALLPTPIPSRFVFAALAPLCAA